MWNLSESKNGKFHAIFFHSQASWRCSNEEKRSHVSTHLKLFPVALYRHVPEEKKSEFLETWSPEMSASHVEVRHEWRARCAVLKFKKKKKKKRAEKRKKPSLRLNRILIEL